MGLPAPSNSTSRSEFLVINVGLRVRIRLPPAKSPLRTMQVWSGLARWLLGREPSGAGCRFGKLQVHGVFELADFLCSNRCDQVLDRQRVDDIVCGEAVGVQRLLVEIGLTLSDLAAIRQGNCGAGDRRALR